MRDAGRPATDGTRRRRWPRRLTIALLLVAILPIPWQHKSNSNLGLAWGMDNRLHVNLSLIHI